MADLIFLKLLNFDTYELIVTDLNFTGNSRVVSYTNKM